MKLELAQRWNHFWFEPCSPTNLGISRIILFVGILLMGALGAQDFARYGWSASPDEVESLWMPVTLIRLLHLGPYSAHTLSLLSAVWKVSLVTSCIGLFTRVSTAISFVLGFVLLSLSSCWGFSHCNTAPVVPLLLAMAVSPCGDALSVDSLLFRRGQHVGESSLYRWPLRFGLVVLVALLGGAGISKLRATGTAFFLSDQIQIFFTRVYLGFGGGPMGFVLLPIVQHPWLCKLLGLSTLLIEVLFPLALIPRLRMVFLPLGMSFAFVNYLLNGSGFNVIFLVYAFTIPWDWLAARFRVIPGPQAG